MQRPATSGEATWFAVYAHDVRTPIGRINGNFEILQDPKATARQRLHALQSIIRASFDLAGVAQVMLLDNVQMMMTENGHNGDGTGT